jgi:anti-sigma-K factor RskA
MNSPELEELAALDALGLLDDAGRRALRTETERDPSAHAVIEAFNESAALLAYAAPQIPPPPALKRELMRSLSAPQKSAAKIILFPQWLPYAAAACLVGVAIYQANEIFGLTRQVGAEHAKAVALQERNDMANMRIASLEAKSSAYLSAKVMVAWDPNSHNGVISIQNLPPAPAGHDYQLWVLDPGSAAPVSAGVLHTHAGSQEFGMGPMKSNGPGFAISLEPSGGRPSPTGAILFAVAPGQ